MTFGVTSTGFVKKTLADVLSEFESRQREEISPVLDVSASSPIGQINGIFANAIAEIWDLAEALYTGADPAVNTGDAQDIVCSYTGTTRLPATKSTVTALATLNAGVTLPAGSLASVQGSPDSVFELVTSVTNPYSGPSPMSSSWQAVDTGPVQALAGTLTVIKTPVSGWTSITNALDAVLGRDVETDAALRLRRIAEVQAQGTSPVDAMAVDLFTSLGYPVKVYENTTELVDADGRTLHSVECVIQDFGALSSSAIAQAIWEAKAAGVATYGLNSGYAVDALGVSRLVYFTRAVALPFEVRATITASGTWSGLAALKARMLAIAATYLAGDDVCRAAYYSTFFPTSETGVYDVSSLTICFDGGTPGTSNLVVGLRNVATLQSTDITISVNP